MMPFDCHGWTDRRCANCPLSSVESRETRPPKTLSAAATNGRATEQHFSDDASRWENREPSHSLSRNGRRRKSSPTTCKRIWQSRFVSTDNSLNWTEQHNTHSVGRKPFCFDARDILFYRTCSNHLSIHAPTKWAAKSTMYQSISNSWHKSNVDFGDTL